MIRNTCILCNSNLNELHNYSNFPIYMGIIKENEKPQYNDMAIMSCKGCGFVQLKNLLDPNILYKTPHNPAIGKTWEEHNKNFSNYILNNNCKNLLEVGGANLKIAKLITDYIQIKSYTILDISDSYECNINPKIIFLRGFIEDIKDDKKYDSVVMSHTFEHLYDPIKTLNLIRNLLIDDGKFIISVPNIENQIIDGFLNAINFEHTFYINHDYIKYISNVCNFDLIDITEYSKYNTFYTLQKKQNVESNKILDKTKASVIYKKHIESVKRDVNNINKKIKNKKVYCFGGHIFTQMLIAFGLNLDNIICILDNDINKIDNFLYGTNIKIKNSSIIKDDTNPIIIVRCSQYNDEIIKSLKNFNSNCDII